MTKDSANRFVDQLCQLIDRCRFEEDLTYSEILGAIELVKFDLLQEAPEGEGEGEGEEWKTSRKRG